MKYIWDELDGTFVANPIRRVRPGQIVPVSVLGGAQVEHLLTIFQSPIGDWTLYPAAISSPLEVPGVRTRDVSGHSREDADDPNSLPWARRRCRWCMFHFLLSRGEWSKQPRRDRSGDAPGKPDKLRS